MGQLWTKNVAYLILGPIHSTQEKFEKAPITGHFETEADAKDRLRFEDWFRKAPFS